MVQRIGNELRTLPRGVYVLFVLMVFGLAVGIWRLAVGLGPSTNLNDAYPWGLWIGFDLFVVAFSGGAFTLAALVYVLHMHELHPAIRPTVLTGLVGYVSVLVILVMDLGRWDRFYHFILYPNINSALFEVSWCILLYTIVLISEFSPVVLEPLGWRKLLAVIQKLTVPLVIVGVTLSTLHQSSLGSLFVVMTERLHPLWHSPLIPVFFFISSLAAGLSMVVAGATVSYWVFKRTLPQKVVANLAWFIPWVLGGYLILKLGELMAVEELHYLFTFDRYSVLFWSELNHRRDHPPDHVLLCVRAQQPGALLGGGLVGVARRVHQPLFGRLVGAQPGGGLPLPPQLAGDCHPGGRAVGRHAGLHPGWPLPALVRGHGAGNREEADQEGRAAQPAKRVRRYPTED